MDYEFIDDKRIINLQIKGSDRQFSMRTQSQSQYDEWVESLTLNIDSSKGAQKMITMDSYRFTEEDKQSFEFWKFLRILEDVFLDEAESGDLILCANKKKFQIQKLKKPSYVDDVFLILKLDQLNGQQFLHEHDKVHILRNCPESCSIIMEKWADFKAYCADKYTDLIYRSIEKDRDDETLEVIQDFLWDKINKPYVKADRIVQKKTKQGQT